MLLVALVALVHASNERIDEQLTAQQSFILQNGSYAQAIFTSFTQLHNNSFDFGDLQYTFNTEILNPNKTQLYDIFVFDSPQSLDYLCYLYYYRDQHQSRPACFGGFIDNCSNCNAINQSLQQFFTQSLYTEFVYQVFNKTQIEKNELGNPRSMCFKGCNSNMVGFTTDLVNITAFVNSAAIIIFDNTHLPLNGTPSTSQLEITYNYNLTVIKRDQSERVTYYLACLWIILSTSLLAIIFKLNSSYKKIKFQHQQLSSVDKEKSHNDSRSTIKPLL